jgi:NADPH:quinone reductase
MGAVQITSFDGPEVLEIVDVPEPTPGPGQQLYRKPPPASTSPTPTTRCPETYLASPA